MFKNVVYGVLLLLHGAFLRVRQLPSEVFGVNWHHRQTETTVKGG